MLLFSAYPLRCHRLTLLPFRFLQTPTLLLGNTRGLFVPLSPRCLLSTLLLYLPSLRFLSLAFLFGLAKGFLFRPASLCVSLVPIFLCAAIFFVPGAPFILLRGLSQSLAHFGRSSRPLSTVDGHPLMDDRSHT
jgi:hypothetical protein